MSRDAFRIGARRRRSVRLRWSRIQRRQAEVVLDRNAHVVGRHLAECHDCIEAQLNSAACCLSRYFTQIVSDSWQDIRVRRARTIRSSRLDRSIASLCSSRASATPWDPFGQAASGCFTARMRTRARGSMPCHRKNRSAGAAGRQVLNVRASNAEGAGRSNRTTYPRSDPLQPAATNARAARRSCPARPPRQDRHLQPPAPNR